MTAMNCTVRAASPHCRLALHSLHHVDHDGQPRKTRFPDDVDVVSASHLVLSLSGVLNTVKVPPSDVIKSQLAQHLVDYFQANATELGIAPVSSMYLGEDGLPNLKITPSYCVPQSNRVHVSLVRIDLNYVWHTLAATDSLIHPFSTHLSLPFKILLDNAVSRFFKWHLVKRYPLIFGPWSQQLRVERPYFDKIFSSISNIIERSSNQSFRKKCSRMLASMQDQHEEDLTAAASALAAYFGVEANDDAILPLSDPEAFSLSMESRYRTCLRRPHFKGSSGVIRGSDASDDEDLSQDQSVLTPDSSQRFDEAFLWQSAPILSTASPHARFDFDESLPSVLPAANIERCSPLDMGMEIEYQDPSEVCSDLDMEDANDSDCLSFCEEEVSDTLLPDSSLVTSVGQDGLSCDLRFDWNGSLDVSHVDGSPDAPHPPLLSPSANRARSPFCQGPVEGCFPGLSTDLDLDLELAFDSESDLDLASDDHALVGGRDEAGNHRDLEHQVGNGSNCFISPEDGAGMEDEEWGIIEDW
ncbi:hypothetical protein FB45DRAFT_897396 [Roridomyces roridus]|uniref:Uncharacterized protein n=1 Tax=Roridomyces roridus TaxID=1738132 RepID=A0AAD7FYI4_9AGAR|nr:hypothetical protein FB45DRAFT_897396 [Roridomyces roridus]